jgi:ribosomal protein L3 glutamine methyltransferase
MVREGSRKSRTVRTLLEYGIEEFEKAGLSYGHGTANALDEAAWLILRALGLPPHDLNTHLDRPLAESQFTDAKALLDRRVATRKPAAYLLNEAWLGPHRFYVDERVIVPRSFIAELLLGGGELSGREPARAGSGEDRPPRQILDLCTGSGCLAILAALRFPAAKVDAADISEDALAVARRNVAEYGLEERVRLVRSDLFGALDGRRYDLVVSNPPYVKASAMRRLPAEYRREPVLALASGADGLEHTRVILAEARRHLEPAGRLVVEIGHNRKALEKAFPDLDFAWPKTRSGKGYVFAIARERLH